MKQYMTYMYKRGSISIETAISFSLVIVFLTSIICITSFLRTDILMQRAVNQTCEDFELFTPFSVTAADSLSTMINALPGDYEYSNIDQLGSLFIGVDILSGGELRASIFDLALSRVFADDIASEYVEYNGSEYFCPESIEVDFIFCENYIEVIVDYQVRTIIGLISRQITGIIPFYGEYALFLNAEEISSISSDAIWQEDNFTRGIFFAQRYGANLPHTFPTISFYDNGTVGSVTSIDLNRPTYSTSVSVCQRMAAQIDRISDFRGARVNVSGEIYEVCNESITGRRAIFVIPEDSPDQLVEAANSMISYGNSMGVEVSVVTDGSSRI
ncbi:MAG: hypothetical protein MJ094_02125 [Saccharofermentans sp.]|nr:hypothetical protein [Saccharofermentans sp.]